jgi:methionine sulfoxide reductase catalytic subunit
VGKMLHHIHAVLFGILLLSGLLLHFSFLRGVLAPYRLLLMRTHAYVGELFCLVLAVYFLHLLGKSGFRSQNNRFSLLKIASILTLLSLSSTGWLLVHKVEFGAAVTAYSFEVHLGLAYFAVLAILWHLWSVLFQNVPDDMPTNRRRFLSWALAGLGSVWVASIGWRLWGGAQIQDVRGSVNCDVFFPVPEPAKTSLPPIGGGMRGKFGEYSAMNFLPCLNQETWRFTIDGLVNRAVTFRWDDFVRLPRTVQVSDFHCVEGWSVFNITYEGLLVSDLLKITGISSTAKYVKFYSADGQYADTLSIEQAHMKDVMIVIMMDGVAIPRVLGGPARLIVPQMYAYKAVKWVNRIELIDKPYLGYWEWHGFDSDAWLGKY